MYYFISDIRVYLGILNEYMDITQPFESSDSGKYQTQPLIKTSETTAYSHPWRLSAPKLDFTKMFSDSIIRPSDSLYVLLLSLGSKSGDTKYCIWVDYWLMVNGSTIPDSYFVHHIHDFMFMHWRIFQNRFN